MYDVALELYRRYVTFCDFCFGNRALAWPGLIAVQGLDYILLKKRREEKEIGIQTNFHEME